MTRGLTAKDPKDGQNDNSEYLAQRRKGRKERVLSFRKVRNPSSDSSHSPDSVKTEHKDISKFEMFRALVERDLTGPGTGLL